MQPFPNLRLPAFECKLTQTDGVYRIYDEFRRKYVVLTPEEWVRQHVLHLLTGQLGYPRGLLQVERGHKYHQVKKRTDILFLSSSGAPLLLVECKAPHIPLTEAVCRQAGVYNASIGARFLAVSNGIDFYCWNFDPETANYQSINKLPDYSAAVI
jgi:hypothetical protein